MKKLLALILALTMCLSLAACSGPGSSGNEQEDTAPDTAQKEANTPEPSQENAEAEGNDILHPDDFNETAEETTDNSADEIDFPYFPWFKQLPDGIEAEIQKLGDFELLIHYKNNTGRDVAFYTECQFFDEFGEDDGWMATVNEFVRDGDDYVAIMECYDYFESYLLYCEIDDPGARIQIANDALSVQTWQNSDRSVHLDMKTTAEDGTSVDGYVFFTDADGYILGYDYVGYGFGDEAEDDTEIPGFEYDDYFVCISAIA